MLTISVVTSTSGNKEDKDLVVYPNPVTNYKVTVNLDNAAEKISFSLYSITGQKVYSEIAGYASSVSISLPQHLSKGMYFLKIKNGMNEVIKSIIIE